MIALGMLLACTTPEPLPELGSVPAFQLTDQSGRPFTELDLREHVSVVDFMFTSCPDICPVLSAHMAEVQDHYKDQPKVQFISISVDPTTDTPSVLTAYAARFNANPERWHFLTGDNAAVKQVVTTGFKMVMEAGTDGSANVLHGERFVVIDASGTIRAYPDPKEPGKSAIYAAVDQLTKE